jgi:hypothetical protein
MQLSQGSNDTFHRLPVTMTYRYWQTADINNSASSSTDPFASLGDTGIPSVPKTLTLQDLIKSRRNSPTQQSKLKTTPGYFNTARDYFNQR